MVIDTRYGKIEGKEFDENVEFLSVPYAKPPVGDRRWKAPERPEPWEGIYHADHVRAIAVQELPDMKIYQKEFYSDPEYRFQVSENCLYLNIWMPKHAGEQKLPVAYWIHGGGFVLGSSIGMEFDGAQYCKKGIVLVSVEYRCNVFGFLAHSWLSEESESCSSGNYGLMDQIAGLEWVYENIEAFGGDRSRITVMGQSAGAMSVQALLLSKKTGTMIAGAILQSGGAYGCTMVEKRSLQEAERLGNFFSEYLNCRSLEELRQKSMEEVRAAAVRLDRLCKKGTYPYFLAPIVDGIILEDGYDELMDHGCCKNVPCLIGTVKNDLTVTEKMLMQKEFSPLYRGCVKFAEKQEEKGKGPTYVYYFSHDLPGDDSGAFHSMDIWYEMGTMARCWRPWTKSDWELSDIMVTAWTDFIKTGNPDPDGQLGWKAYSQKNRQVYVFQ